MGRGTAPPNQWMIRYVKRDGTVGHIGPIKDVKEASMKLEGLLPQLSNGNLQELGMRAQGPAVIELEIENLRKKADKLEADAATARAYAEQHGYELEGHQNE